MKNIVLVTALAISISGATAQESTDINAIAAQEWRAYIEPLLPIGEHLAAAAPDQVDAQLRQEMYRMAFGALSAGYIGRFLGDVEHPDFWPLLNTAYPFWAPNPDNVYQIAPVEDSGSYRISGYRGSVRIVDLQLGSGDVLIHGTGKLGPTLTNADLDKFHIGKDRSVDILLSHERPAGYKGDWLELKEKTTYILVRQIAYDWLREVDARVTIERLDRPAIRPRKTAQQIETDLQALSAWTANWSKIGPKWVDRYRLKGMFNQVKIGDVAGEGGLTTAQKYIEGLYELEPDEAVIYETEMPKTCHYWNIQLTDMMWNAIDYMNRQSHLNGFLAKVDKDGKFRAVISGSDPGVPNWLDSAGYKRGMLEGRWRDCSSYPTPILTKVKLADLRKYLPADTPVVTAEQRDAAIRLRRKGAQLRRRW